MSTCFSNIFKDYTPTAMPPVPDLGPIKFEKTQILTGEDNVVRIDFLL
jgi:hypothetical protein